jgi:RNA polymerase sigma factor (sigma-70 family)
MVLMQFDINAYNRAREAANQAVWNPDDRDDRVQDLVAARLAAGQELPNHPGFLHIALRRRDIDQHRRQRRILPTAPHMLASIHPGEVAEVPETLTDPLVLAAMNGLSANAQQVVTMRIVKGYSVEATADSLGISPGTVKSRLHRALGSLAHSLQTPYENGDL